MGEYTTRNRLRLPPPQYHTEDTMIKTAIITGENARFRFKAGSKTIERSDLDGELRIDLPTGVDKITEFNVYSGNCGLKLISEDNQ